MFGDSLSRRPGPHSSDPLSTLACLEQNLVIIVTTHINMYNPFILYYSYIKGSIT